MNLRVGIVGLPNVGKSTLFNALTQQAAKVQNVPFTTIEPNVGVVPVPDERLEKLSALSHSAKITPTTIEFVDIAGLVRGAHRGEGLGNQFLSHIRSVDAILHVVRFFDNTDIIHVESAVDPSRDAETINTELALADLATVQKMLANVAKRVKGQDQDAAALDALLQRYEAALSTGTSVHAVARDEREQALAKTIHLLTNKPILYLANVSEKQLAAANDITRSFAARFSPLLPLSVRIEQEIIELPDTERRSFLAVYGLTNTGLERLIQASYALLGLITFLTTGPTETRAWTVFAGSTARQAAGQIHSDMARGFIRAETVAYQDLIAAGSYTAARAAGRVRDEGKEYVVQDGDVMLFKFSV